MGRRRPTSLTATPAAADVSQPTPIRPPGTEGLTTLLNWGMWLVTFAGIVGVLISAGSMMLAHRRGQEATLPTVELVPGTGAVGVRLTARDGATDLVAFRTDEQAAVVACGETIGKVTRASAEAFGIPFGVPVAAAIGDNQASLLATLREPEKELALPLGTGDERS